MIEHDDLTPAERQWRDALREYRDKEADVWYELPDHPDLFTLGVTREHAEHIDVSGENSFAGWSLERIREMYGPLTLLTGFAMPGDTVTVDGREGVYQGRVSPGTGHRVAFRCGSSDAPYWQTETVSVLAEIEIVRRSAPRHASAAVRQAREDTPRKPEPGEPLNTEPLADWERELLEPAHAGDHVLLNIIGEFTDLKGSTVWVNTEEFGPVGLTGIPVSSLPVLARKKDVVEDTPRKPEPGDRVRVTMPNGNTFEGMYVTEYRAGKDQVSVVEGDCILTVTGHPEDLVWEVIEPARPADPKCDIEEDTEPGDTLLWKYNPAAGSYDDGTCDRSVRWEDLWSEAVTEGSKLYPIRRERGPVIGGE